MDKYPVTAGQYKKCVDAEVCSYNGYIIEVENSNNANINKDDHPMNIVNYDGASARANWWYSRAAYEPGPHRLVTTMV